MPNSKPKYRKPNGKNAPCNSWPVNASASIETLIDRIGTVIYSVVAMHTGPVVTKVRVERSRSVATHCIVWTTPTIRRHLFQSVVNVVGVGIVGKRPKNMAWVTLRARRHAGTLLHHHCNSSRFLCTDRVVIEERTMTLNPRNRPNRHTFLCEYISDVDACGRRRWNRTNSRSIRAVAKSRRTVCATAVVAPLLRIRERDLAHSLLSKGFLSRAVSRRIPHELDTIRPAMVMLASLPHGMGTTWSRGKVVEVVLKHRSCVCVESWRA
jgi:hypothetical protein